MVEGLKHGLKVRSRLRSGVVAAALLGVPWQQECTFSCAATFFTELFGRLLRKGFPASRQAQELLVRETGVCELKSCWS